MKMRLTKDGILRVKQEGQAPDLAIPINPLLPSIEEPDWRRPAPERERQNPPGSKPPREVGPPKSPPRVMILAQSSKRAASGVQIGTFELKNFRESDETYVPFRVFKKSLDKSVSTSRITQTSTRQGEILSVLVTEHELKNGINVGMLRDYVNNPSTPVNRFRLLLKTSRYTPKE